MQIRIMLIVAGLSGTLANSLCAAEYLPPKPEQAVAELAVSRETPDALVWRAWSAERAMRQQQDVAKRQIARKQYYASLRELRVQAQARSLITAAYGDPDHEDLVWFWLNHFSVDARKNYLAALVSDYEVSAIRPHANGHFKDLLRATARHPAMLSYLDNTKNKSGEINENYARELMELHTLGVGGGYTQRDVQELARILTGVTYDPRVGGGTVAPKPGEVRDGLFLFDPKRHDFGDKIFLGHLIKGQGLSELDEAIEILASHPSTARFVSLRLATYFVADDPPEALVTRMAQAFQASGGDISKVLAVMRSSPEAIHAEPRFKDGREYLLSMVRLAYPETPPAAAEIVSWAQRLSEAPFERATPDGYPIKRQAWANSAQLAARFELAQRIGPPTALSAQAISNDLSPTTREELRKTRSAKEWNVIYMSSPEFMRKN